MTDKNNFSKENLSYLSGNNFYIISDWFGRFGNNILQIIRASHSALNNNDISFLSFPIHPLLNNNKIIFKEKENDKENILIKQDTFFYYNRIKEPIQYKNMFKTYVKSLLKTPNKNINIDPKGLYIHFRGGDIFSEGGGHHAYIQPPLYFYKKIIEDGNYTNIYSISEDNKNPCINALKNIYKDKFKIINNDILTDFYTLSNCNNLVLSNSTFSFCAYFNNDNLKNLYIAENNFFTGTEWKNYNDNLNVVLIPLPNYNQKWSNTLSQKNMMIHYNPNKE